MGFAPANTEVSPYQFTPPTITHSDFHPELSAVRLDRLHEMVEEFWKRVAADERISGQLRAFIAGWSGNVSQQMIPGLEADIG